MSTGSSIRSRIVVLSGLRLSVPVLASAVTAFPALGGYEEDIAPIMRDKCNSCHASQAPMLGSYDQVKASVASIVATVSIDPSGPEKAKLMPKNGPKLDQTDIDKIKAWQSAGMPEKGGGSATSTADPATQPDTATTDDPTSQPETAAGDPGSQPGTDPGTQPGSDVTSPGTDNGKPTPLVIDLEGQGLFAFGKKPVFFDIRGTGQRLLSWPSAASAFVALDLDQNGKITSGRELFGDGTMLGDTGRRATNGFEALAQHDKNHDGMIDQADPIFAQLKLWHDKNGNGNTDPGELMSVAESGIKSFGLTYESHSQVVSDGEEIPLLIAWYVAIDKSGTPRNKVLADIFLTDFSKKTRTNAGK